MRYEHILRAVYAEPWLITGPAHAAIRALVEQHLLGQFAAERKPGVDMCGQEVAVDQMEVRDGVAIIPVGGVMARRLSGWERGAGAVDTLDVIADLDDAMKDPNVNAVCGDPVTVEGRTVVPLAKVGYAFGMGVGRTTGAEEAAAAEETVAGEAAESVPEKAADGGGGVSGGGGVLAHPLAVVEVTPEGTWVKPVVDEQKLALAAGLLGAWVVFCLARTLVKIFGHDA